MRKYLPLFFTVLPLQAMAQHAQHQSFEEAREMLFEHTGNTTHHLLLAERLEVADHDDGSTLTWDIQGWVGKDLDRLWLKSEGHDGEDSSASGELQLLYSKGVRTYWDFQAGLRHDFNPGEEDRDYLVTGIQGLAPYWFETDLAFFLSEKGDLSTRLELEYELFFSQRLILQPRAEVTYAFSEDAETGSGQGVNEASVGLRLRYEFSRSFAPYLGVEWTESYGDTARYLEAAGEGSTGTSVVAGLRFRF